MKAFQLNTYNGISSCRLVEVDEPAPTAGEVAVRVRAAAINPVDWKIAEGAGPAFGCALPLTLGCDVAGEIAAVGPGVTRFAKGDRVAAYVNLQRCGAFADICLAKDSELAPVPEGVDFADAAGLPVAVLTADQALFGVAKLHEGQRVLVHAASGGVGAMAVQIAKLAGAEVLATASARNEEFVHELGADRFIDYRADRFEDVARDVDIVLDTVGGETQARSFAVLKRGGSLVSIVGQPDAGQAAALGVHASFMGVRPNGAALDAWLARVARKELFVEIARRFPLAEAGTALEHSKTGRTRGKLVLEA